MSLYIDVFGFREPAPVEIDDIYPADNQGFHTLIPDYLDHMNEQLIELIQSSNHHETLQDHLIDLVKKGKATYTGIFPKKPKTRLTKPAQCIKYLKWVIGSQDDGTVSAKISGFNGSVTPEPAHPQSTYTPPTNVKPPQNLATQTPIATTPLAAAPTTTSFNQRWHPVQQRQSLFRV